MDALVICAMVIEKENNYFKLFRTLSIDDCIINLVTTDQELGREAMWSLWLF